MSHWGYPEHKILPQLQKENQGTPPSQGAKNLAKSKKTAPSPPKDTEDSEAASEEDDSEEEAEPIPQQKAVTPAKAGVTPGKKSAVVKNGKKAKQESEEDDSEEPEEETPSVKKPTPKKPVAKKTREKPSAKKLSVTTEESEEDDDEDCEAAMDTTPVLAKAKKTVPAKAEESEEDDYEEEDDDEEEKEAVKESGKRKQELPKQKSGEAKKPKTEGTESEAKRMTVDKINKLMNPLEPGTSRQCVETDWNKCFICQEEKAEVLRCPAESKRDTKGAGYKTISDLLVGFCSVGCLPRTINLSRLDEGEGIEATLQQRKAQFHDSCRLQFNKTKLERAGKRKIPTEDNVDNSRKFTHQSLEEKSSSCTKICFFCDQPASAGGSLCKASTFGLDTRVRQCALKLQDTALLAKVSAGDLIAQAALYHIHCLVSLYNRARDKKTTQESDVDQMNHGIAFAELVSYIEDARMDSEVAPVFKLVDLCSLYSVRMKQLGSDLSGRIHSTKLKDRILAYFPDMEAHKQGRDVVLIFDQDIGSALRKACEHDADSDAVHLAKAANIVRRDIFKMKNHFGSFGDKCQEGSVPSSLLALVAMVMNGPNIKAQSSSSTMPQPILTVAQLLMYNSLVRRACQ